MTNLGKLICYLCMAYMFLMCILIVVCDVLFIVLHLQYIDMNACAIFADKIRIVSFTPSV